MFEGKRLLGSTSMFLVINLSAGLMAAFRDAAAAASGDLSEVASEFFFFDDEKAISIGLDQPEIVEALHKQTDPGPRRAHHLRQFFVRNPQFDANAARVLLAHCARQL
jgi:hypothetical protein